MERNLQLSAANCELKQDKDVLTQDKIAIMGRVYSLTQELIDVRSPDPRLCEENFGLQSEITELKSENARLVKKFGHSKSKHQKVDPLSPVLDGS